MIELHFESTEILNLSSEFFVSWLRVVCESEGKELGPINLIFCSDDYLLKMNREHLNHDYYTDIITFDYTDSGVVSGDLFISVDRVEENALKEKELFHVELNRVVVHGVLHLCGYGDKSKEEERLMREKENDALALIVSRETND